MKKLLPIALTLLFFTSGCSLVRTPAITISTALDYSEYQKVGFFISEANSVNFEYEPIGSVSVLSLDGYKLAENGNKIFKDDVLGTEQSRVVSTTGEYISPTRKDVLKQLYTKAKEIGANAIINLKINYIQYSTKESSRTGYEGTGMAIKK